uniref:DNA-directed RNA polymerase subunit n=1 Tax=Strigamia maritima TaxID=126957 RepID=T1J7T5_STRMM
MTKSGGSCRQSDFTGETDFCPECGAILPLPGREDSIKCRVCSFAVNVTEFNGIEHISTVTFNQENKCAKTGVSRTPLGPLVDRKCPKCGNDQMTFATLQTRSADEGQTVFYTCTQCK